MLRAMLLAEWPPWLVCPTSYGHTVYTHTEFRQTGRPGAAGCPRSSCVASNSSCSWPMAWRAASDARVPADARAGALAFRLAAGLHAHRLAASRPACSLSCRTAGSVLVCGVRIRPADAALPRAILGQNGDTRWEEPRTSAPEARRRPQGAARHPHRGRASGGGKPGATQDRRVPSPPTRHIARGWLARDRAVQRRCARRPGEAWRGARRRRQTRESRRPEKPLVWRVSGSGAPSPHFGSHGSLLRAPLPCKSTYTW